MVLRHFEEGKTVDAAGSKAAIGRTCSLDMKARARPVGNTPAERAGVSAGSSTKLEVSVKREFPELPQKIEGNDKNT